jgi:hypothetical protein
VHLKNRVYCSGVTCERQSSPHSIDSLPESIPYADPWGGTNLVMFRGLFWEERKIKAKLVCPRTSGWSATKVSLGRERWGWNWLKRLVLRKDWWGLSVVEGSWVEGVLVVLEEIEKLMGDCLFVKSVGGCGVLAKKIGKECGFVWWYCCGVL